MGLRLFSETSVTPLCRELSVSLAALNQMCFSLFFFLYLAQHGLSYRCLSHTVSPPRVNLWIDLPETFFLLPLGNQNYSRLWTPAQNETKFSWVGTDIVTKSDWLYGVRLEIATRIKHPLWSSNFIRKQEVQKSLTACAVSQREESELFFNHFISGRQHICSEHLYTLISLWTHELFPPIEMSHRNN